MAAVVELCACTSFSQIACKKKNNVVNFVMPCSPPRSMINHNIYSHCCRRCWPTLLSSALSPARLFFSFFITSITTDRISEAINCIAAVSVYFTLNVNAERLSSSQLTQKM